MTKILLMGLIFSGVALSLAGCATDPTTVPPISEPESKVYHESYDEVWRAIQLALRKYPVKLNNIETGVLETDYITDDKLFSDPSQSEIRGLRYRIMISAIRGRVDSMSVVKVICTKVPEIQYDFFRGYQPIASNGLEEDVILYRIGRYLDMEHILERANHDSQ